MKCARCNRSLRLGIVVKLPNGRKATYGSVCAKKVDGGDVVMKRLPPMFGRMPRAVADERQADLFGVVA